MTTKRRSIKTPAEAHAAVIGAFPRILRRHDTASADLLRESFDFDPTSVPGIGGGIRELHRQGIIEMARVEVSSRRATHGRLVRVWRLTKRKDPISG